MLYTTLDAKLNISTKKENNLGFTTRLNINHPKFDQSAGIVHTSTDDSATSETYEAQTNKNYKKSYSTAYFDATYGNFELNITDEFLFGAGTNKYNYDGFDDGGNASAAAHSTTDTRNLMNSLQVNLGNRLGDHVKVEYGGETSQTRNKNDVKSEQKDIPTELTNSCNENSSDIYAGYANVRLSGEKWSVYTNAFNVSASLKGFSLTAAYHRKKNALTADLTAQEGSDGVVIKRVVNIPHMGKTTVGLDWRGQYTRYYPTVSASVTRQSLKFRGMRFCKPVFSIDMNNYIILPKDWSLQIYAGYTSEGDNMTRHSTDLWTTELGVAKTWRDFYFSLGLSNLGMGNHVTTTREMNNVRNIDVDHQDRTGVTLQIYYSLNYARAKYTNKHQSSENRRISFE